MLSSRAIASESIQGLMLSRSHDNKLIVRDPNICIAPEFTRFSDRNRQPEHVESGAISQVNNANAMIIMFGDKAKSYTVEGLVY